MNTSPGPGPSTPRSDPSNPYPTTFIQADPSSFKQIVQSLTGSDNTNKNESQPSIKLYERRNTSLKHHLHIPTRVSHHPYLPLSPSPRGPHSPRLLLSPVTPLLFDPFTQSPSVDIVAEDKAIADKGFFLHPVSPGESQPRLLPLFPLTSPR